MNITPTTLKISQLFSTANEQFSIPAYQRRYSWGWKQIAELFDDINLLKTNETHLLGNIVCLTSTHTVGINALELVDGQQRITSLSIFLKAIRDRYQNLDETEVTSEIDAYLFCKGIDRKPLNKILLGDLDNPDYQKLFKLEKMNQIKNDNLLKAYEYLKTWLDELDIDALNTLYYKFLNNVVVVRLDVGDAKDAYKLFETINNRGLKLSATDIIKNFLLGHASSIDSETLEEVRNNWKQLIINLDGIDTDNFFRQLMCGKLHRKITFTYLIDDFKKYYLRIVQEAKTLPEYDTVENTQTDNDTDIEYDQEEVTIIEFSEKLTDFSSIYANICNKTFKNTDNVFNKYLFNLQRIKSIPTYILLLDLFYRENITEAQKLKILTMLESFMLRRHICENRTGELDDIFAKLTKLKDENIVENIRNSLQQHLPANAEFENKFSQASFKGNENRAKYILEKFEYNEINDEGEYTLNSGKELHLEHIIPQTIDTKKSKKEFGDWIPYLGNDALTKHKMYVNRIGNFTLLGQKLNIAASNNPFDDKLTEYKKSNIMLTKKIYENFKNFKFSEVEERSNYFAKKAPQIWSLI